MDIMKGEQEQADVRFWKRAVVDRKAFREVIEKVKKKTQGQKNN